MPRELTAIGSALDEISWYWLSDNFPRLAEAVEVETTKGADPVQVRRYVMRQTQRMELALRCEQALPQRGMAVALAKGTPYGVPVSTPLTGPGVGGFRTPGGGIGMPREFKRGEARGWLPPGVQPTG